MQTVPLQRLAFADKILYNWIAAVAVRQIIYTKGNRTFQRLLVLPIPKNLKNI